MPIALLLVELSELYGYSIWAVAPEHYQITRKTLGGIINTHLFTEKLEIQTLIHDEAISISYYTGKKSRDLIILLLELTEDLEKYQKKFENILENILKNKNYSASQLIISKLFNEHN